MCRIQLWRPIFLNETSGLSRLFVAITTATIGIFHVYSILAKPQFSASDLLYDKSPLGAGTYLL